MTGWSGCGPASTALSVAAAEESVDDERCIRNDPFKKRGDHDCKLMERRRAAKGTCTSPLHQKLQARRCLLLAFRLHRRRRDREYRSASMMTWKGFTHHHRNNHP